MERDILKIGGGKGKRERKIKTENVEVRGVERERRGERTKMAEGEREGTRENEKCRGRK